MKLDINGIESFEEPGVNQIHTAIANLTDDSFIILSRDDEDYIQAYRNTATDFQLEYRAGSEAEHYECVTDGIASNQIQEAFAAFLAGADDWHSAWAWRKITL